METTVLVVPRYRKNLWGNAVAKDTVMLAKALATRYRVLLPVPQWWDGTPLPENVTVIPIEMETQDFQEEMMITQQWVELFNQFKGQYQYDAVLNLRSINGLMLERLLSFNSWASYLKVPVPVVQSPYIQVRVPEVMKYDTAIMADDGEIEVAEIFACKHLMLRSPGEVELVRREMAKYLLPAALKRLMDRTFWVAGVDSQAFLAKLEQVEPEPWDVIYAGRTASVKNPMWAASVMDLLQPRFKCCITSQQDETAATEQIRKKYPNLPVFTNQPYEKYLARLKGAKVMIVSSKKESFCMTMFEAFLAGCFVVVKDEFWVNGLLPKWYPRAETPEKAAEIAAWAVRNPEKSRSYVERMQEFIRTEYGMDQFAARLTGKFQELMRESYTHFIEKASDTSLVGVARRVVDPSKPLHENVKLVKESMRSKNAQVPEFLVRVVLKYKRGDYGLGG